MKKRILLVILLAFAARAVNATLPVVDYSHIAQDAANEVQNLAKYAVTASKETETALNTLRTYENTVLQVARFGNPAALQSIPGVSTIAELYQTYGELQQAYQQLQGMVNPRNLQYNYNSILSAYSQPQWNGFQSLNGMSISPNPGLYQFPTSDYNVGVTMTQRLDELEQKKKQLTKDRDQAIQSLQSATTASDVQKYHAVLDGLNAAIADVNQSEQQLYNRGRIQQKQNASAQQIYQASQAERIRASDYQAIDAGLNGLPIGDMDRPLLWGGSR
jgi:hypothetical protein